jgi:hypothetical protein
LPQYIDAVAAFEAWEEGRSATEREALSGGGVMNFRPKRFRDWWMNICPEWGF